MTQEDKKQLLLKDLCGRLPYGVYIEHTSTKIRGKLNNINVVHRYNGTNSVQEVEAAISFLGDCCIDVIYFKPYLRPTNSMTEEEEKEFAKIMVRSQDCSYENNESATTMVNDWYLSKHFDVRGLIPKGLAIEVTKENNPYEN